MSKIKSITNLSGEVNDMDWTFSPKASVDLDGSIPGFMRSMQLGPCGLTFARGKDFVGLSKSDLWKLAESKFPELFTPKPVQVPKPEPSTVTASPTAQTETK